ncbi:MULTISPECIES: M1 family metallopeptidase [Streptomyces]|uniref:Aminopeptidase N n=1 Tax=Streptomyces yunnanensis TaxID=156453 RepID=A0ABY8A5R3_9ACTN|nr:MULTISPECIES: M1 family metallopeptidase [Streptomyces]AJC55550.1 Peptidase M1 membrane alanine aminopeptidase [Streptomyces sp. 769]WEB40039.1 M1 family metallopeptidase [Streptomyces yunnanensis]
MSLPLRRPSGEPDGPAADRSALDRDRPRARRGRIPRRAAALGLAVAATIAAAAPQPAEPLGIGDRLFPMLGNPGYHVTSYDISLDYSGHNDRPMDVVTVIKARATANLDRLNLDFADGTVRSVLVDGQPARHEQAGEDLVLTPASHIHPGQDLRIVVQHTSDPRGRGDGGWIRTTDGLAMANQADAAHRVFPCNDHPSDKAEFTFHITTPEGLVAVANGLPVGEGARGARRTWTYRTAHPMATELAQISIGRSSVVNHRGPHGLPLRDVVPSSARLPLARWLAKTPDQMAWMESKVGPFPFEAYGVLIADASTGFELETQTLSLFEKRLFTTVQLPDWYVESVMVHELSHQWFGDSVSPRRWSDVWLNEAHATWYEALYADEKGDHRASLETRMRHAYEASDGWRAEGGPPALPKVPDKGRKTGIFRPVIYDGSALVLYALRHKMGKAGFERLEREWVAKHRDGVAGTADFIDLASQVYGHNLSGFFWDWLYGAKTPPMPGHPDWKQQQVKKVPADGGKQQSAERHVATTPGAPHLHKG